MTSFNGNFNFKKKSGDLHPLNKIIFNYHKNY